MVGSGLSYHCTEKPAYNASVPCLAPSASAPNVSTSDGLCDWAARGSMLKRPAVPVPDLAVIPPYERPIPQP